MLSCMQCKSRSLTPCVEIVEPAGCSVFHPLRRARLGCSGGAVVYGITARHARRRCTNAWGLVSCALRLVPGSKTGRAHVNDMPARGGGPGSFGPRVSAGLSKPSLIPAVFEACTCAPPPASGAVFVKLGERGEASWLRSTIPFPEHFLLRML
jgi:hypothetical protein